MAGVKEVELTIKPRLDAVTVRPGDKLLVRVPPRATLDEVERMRSQIVGLLPGVETIFIAAEQVLVYRPGGDA